LIRYKLWEPKLENKEVGIETVGRKEPGEVKSEDQKLASYCMCHASRSAEVQVFLSRKKINQYPARIYRFVKDETKDLSLWWLYNRRVLRWWWLGCLSQSPFLSHGDNPLLSFILFKLLYLYIFLSLCFLIMFGSLFFFQVDVVLRGYSGYNTRWALKVAERIFPPVESGGVPPLAVTVFFGANDACLPDRYSAFQNVPLHEYKQNLHSIISFFKVYTLLTILSGFYFDC